MEIASFGNTPEQDFCFAATEISPLAVIASAGFMIKATLVQGDLRSDPVRGQETHAQRSDPVAGQRPAHSSRNCAELVHGLH